MTDEQRPREAAVRRVDERPTDADRPNLTLVLHKHSRSWWPIGLAVIVLAVVGAITTVIIYPLWAAKDLAEQGGRAAVDAVGRAVEKVAQGLQPQVTRQETITIISEQAQRQAKLVVMEQPVRVQIEKADEYSLLWDYLYLGQNTATLQIDGNRVQWVVDLTRFDADGVIVDEAAKTVTLRFPPPRLDTEMVVVQTDPARIQVRTARGWARWPGSAEQLVEEAKREIRPRVILGANTRENRAAAHEAAEATLRAFFQLLTERWEEAGYRVTIEVEESTR